jgi:hypothetical protein
MTDREIREFDSYVRTNTFGESIAAENAPGSTAAAKFAVIATVVAKLSPERANQVRNRNTSKEVLVRTLALEVQNIHRTAVSIALDEPGFADTFHLPANYTEGCVVACAEGFLKQLDAQTGDTAADTAAKAAKVAKFVAHEMSADFVTHLRNDCDAITAANKEAENKRENNVGNTANVGPTLKLAGDAVTSLNAIMHNRYANQPDKLAAWMTASHIERDPKRNSKKSDAPTPPTPPA